METAAPTVDIHFLFWDAKGIFFKLEIAIKTTLFIEKTFF